MILTEELKTELDLLNEEDFPTKFTELSNLKDMKIRYSFRYLQLTNLKFREYTLKFGWNGVYIIIKTNPTMIENVP